MSGFHVLIVILVTVTLNVLPVLHRRTLLSIPTVPERIECGQTIGKLMLIYEYLLS